MFLGQVLTAENRDIGGGVVANSSTVYTPWFPREGDGGTFAMEVLRLSLTDGSDSVPQLTMTVQTKNSEDADPSPSAGGLASASATNTSPGGAPGVSKVNVTGCKELVRCKFELTDTAGSLEERVYYAVFRCLNPSWVTN